MPVQHTLPAPSPRCSRERVGVRALSGEFGLDCGKNAFEIAKNIVVPESKYSVTFFSQTAISYRVCSRFIVLSAVNLNYEKSFAADEITDVTAYRLLPDCSAIRPLPAKSGERLKKLSHQSLHPLHRCAVGEYGLRQHGFGDAEMIVQYALDDRAQVGGRREVAGFIEIGGF